MTPFMYMKFMYWACVIMPWVSSDWMTDSRDRDRLSVCLEKDRLSVCLERL